MRLPIFMSAPALSLGLVLACSTGEGSAQAAGASAPKAEAQSEAQTTEARTDTPSGLPVPRFVSLKFRRTVCRIGPSFEHPTLYTYKKISLPVRVTAETTDHWRRIEDFWGDACWAHQTTLIGVNHAIVSRKVDLLESPRQGAIIRAHLERGVVAKLEKAKPRKGWRQVSVGEITGWAPQEALWGAE
jgi:SH3-like domain-containing protein